MILFHSADWLYFYLRQGGNVFARVCLFVCLSVSKITQKVMDRSFWSFQAMSEMAKTISDLILGVIQKESWMLDHFEIFVTITFNEAVSGKPLQSRRWCCHIANHIALAEVCGLWPDCFLVHIVYNCKSYSCAVNWIFDFSVCVCLGYLRLWCLVWSRF